MQQTPRYSSLGSVPRRVRLSRALLPSSDAAPVPVVVLGLGMVAFSILTAAATEDPTFLAFDVLFLLVGVALVAAFGVRCWEHLMLLRYGTATRARALRSRGVRTVWLYRDVFGREYEPSLEGHAPEGAVGDVLYAPWEPTLAVWVRPEHFKLSPVEDQRPQLSPSLGGRAEQPGAPARTFLSLTYGPQSASYKKLRQEAGHLLRKDAGSLVWYSHDLQSMGSVYLYLPFQIELTAWPKPGGLVDVCVQLQEQGSPYAKDRAVRFQVELAQREVDQKIPVQQESALYLSREDFAAIWEALLFYGQAQGKSLAGRLSLS